MPNFVSRNRSWIGHNAPLFLFLGVGLFAYVMRSIGWFEMMPGDLADSRFNNLILEHLYLWSKGDAENLLSPDFFYPFRNALAFSDNHFGTGAIYGFLRYAGVDRYTAYQLWFVFGHTLNVVAGYWAFRRLGLSPLAAAAGAFVYAFALPNLPKEGHSQMTYRFGAILAFTSFWQGMDKRNPKYFVESTFWMVWQFYCTIYIGFFTVFLLVATTLSVLILDRGRPVWNSIRSIAALDVGRAAKFWGALAVLTFALYWLLNFYASTGAAYGFKREHIEVLAMTPHWESYLIADRSAIWGSLSSSLGQELRYRWEHQMFFGIAVIGLAIWGTVLSFANKTHLSRLGKSAAIVVVLLIALTLMTPFGSLYAFALQVPGISAIRAVTRIAIILALPLAILVSIAALQLKTLAKTPAFASLGLAAVLSAEVFAYQSYNTPKQAWIDRLAQIEAQAPSEIQSGSVFFMTGVEKIPYEIEIDAMMLAQTRGALTLNGYSGNLSPGYVPPSGCATVFERAGSNPELHRRGAAPVHLLQQQVIRFDLAPCAWTPSQQWLTEPVRWDIPPKLDIQLAPTDKPDVYIVSIKNNSDLTLATLSANNQPVRMSWRWRSEGDDANPAEFESRLDLGFDLPPGEQIQFEANFTPPAEPQAVRLEVTLVQEGVAWFHMLGMPIATLDVVRSP